MVTVVSEAQHKVMVWKYLISPTEGLHLGQFPQEHLYLWLPSFSLHVKNNEVTWLALLKGKSTIWVEGRCF